MRALTRVFGALAAVALLAGVARAEGPTPEAAPVASPFVGPPAPNGVARALDADVERHAVLGQRLLERGQTQEAIAEFRRAYELRADPRFLYDIGDGYRRLGLREQALFFFEHYLAAAPEAPDREDVEEQIAALRRGAAPAAAAPAPSLARDVVIAPAPAEAPPPWRRWWSWTALGAVVAAGVVTALVLGRSQTAVPQTALGDKKFY